MHNCRHDLTHYRTPMRHFNCMLYNSYVILCLILPILFTNLLLLNKGILHQSNCPIGTNIYNRYKQVLAAVDCEHPFVAPTFYCKYNGIILYAYLLFCNWTIDFISVGSKEIQRYADAIILNGGEGVILRQTNSPYNRGRSQSFMKLKVINNSNTIQGLI